MKITDSLTALLKAILLIMIVTLLLEINFAIKYGYLLPLEQIADFRFLF